MMFMQYGIGPDMAICLIKAIFFSLLSDALGYFVSLYREISFRLS